MNNQPTAPLPPVGNDPSYAYYLFKAIHGSCDWIFNVSPSAALISGEYGPVATNELFARTSVGDFERFTLADGRLGLVLGTTVGPLVIYQPTVNSMELKYSGSMGLTAFSCAAEGTANFDFLLCALVYKTFFQEPDDLIG